MTATIVLALSAALGSAQTPAADPSEATPQAAFEELASGFLAFHLYFNPVRASAVGDRDYDARLPDVGRAAIHARGEAYQSWLDRLYAIDASALVGDAVQDRVLIEYAIRTELLSLVEVQDWQRDPMYYLDILSRAVATLAEDTGVPSRDRMDALTSRLRQLATLLAEGRANLENPPASFTKNALRSAERLSVFVGTHVPTAFTDVPPGPRKADFDGAVAQAVGQLERFQAFLREDLALRSSGDAQLGPDRLGWLLKYRDHVEASPDQLLQILDLEIAGVGNQVGRAPTTTPATGVGRLEARADEIISSARNHIFRNLFATIPSDTRPIVSTRPSIGAWDQGGVWGPGPLQPYDGPATLYALNDVDQPGSDGDLHSFLLMWTFPGAFLASMYARRSPTRVRKVLRPPTLDDSWARYSVDAIVADGFEPDLRDQHARDRFRQLSITRATLLFHLGRIDLAGTTAALEAELGISNTEATMLGERLAQRPLSAGVLGSLQIAGLKRDFLGDEKDREEGRTLRRFHDAFLASGLPPTRARAVLLPNSEGAALR